MRSIVIRHSPSSRRRHSSSHRRGRQSWTLTRRANGTTSFLSLVAVVAAATSLGSHVGLVAQLMQAIGSRMGGIFVMVRLKRFFASGDAIAISNDVMIRGADDLVIWVGKALRCDRRRRGCSSRRTIRRRVTKAAKDPAGTGDPKLAS